MTLRYAQEVDPVILLVPVHNAVHLEPAVRKWQNLLSVDLHVYQMLKVSCRSIAQRRNCDVGTDVGGETGHGMLINPAAIVPANAMRLWVEEGAKKNQKISKIGYERKEGTRIYFLSTTCYRVICPSLLVHNYSGVGVQVEELKRLTHLHAVPHWTFAKAHYRQVLLSVQPDNADFSLRYPGNIRVVAVPGEREGIRKRRTVVCILTDCHRYFSACLITYSFANMAGGVSSRLRKSLVSAKSAIKSLTVGFGVPGFG